MVLKPLCLIAALLAPLPAFAAGEHGHGEDEHVAVSDFGLIAIHAWTRATSASEALVFVELENGAARTITLTGAQSQAARAATLVGFQSVGGKADYALIPMLPLEPNAEIALTPFGLAIRLEGLTAPLAQGGEIEVTLLTDAGALEMHVAVEAADARQHSHAGHAHD